MNKLLSLLIYLLMQLLQRRTAAQVCSNNPNVTYPAPVATSGWEYRLIANGLTRPRGIAFDADGGLLVVQSGVGLTHLTLDDGGGTCLSVASNTTLIADPNLNHGLALSGDGKTIYVSSAESVFSFAYDSQAVSVDLSSNVTLVTNMSNSDHTTRTLLVSKKQPGTLLVSRGSSSNEDDDARDINSGHSQIRSYNIAQIGPGDSPYDFLDGTLIGWGLRNSVGVAEHPDTGGIWSVENSVDQLQRQGQDIHQNNPGEELNYHGVLGSSDHQGGNYGYPDCYTLWSTAGFPNLGNLQVGDQFADDDAPSNVTDTSCNTDYVPPRIAFQAHSAPLDIKFTPNASEAFVTFHGSWNRNEATGYRIVSLAFDSNGQPTAPQNSTNAVTDIIANADVTNCPDQCFRPVGLAWDSDDRLWFSSDATGEIFVLERTNASNGGGGNPGDGNPNDGNPNDDNPNDGNPNDGNPNDGNPNDGNPGDGNGGDGNGGGNGQNAAGGLISERHGTVVVAQAAVLAGLLLA